MSDTAVAEVETEGASVSDTPASPPPPPTPAGHSTAAEVDPQAYREQADRKEEARLAEIFDKTVGAPAEKEVERKEPVSATEPAKAAAASTEASKPVESTKESDTTATALVDDYEGLDAKAIKTLRSVSMLPEKEVWAKMPQRLRQTALADAKKEVADKTKAFEASRRPAQDSQPAPVTRPADVTPKQAEQVTTAKANDGELDLSAELKPLVDVLGLDGAKPIEAALRKIHSQNQDAIRRSQVDLQRVTQAQQELNDAAERQRVAVLEAKANSGRAELGKALPIILTDNEQWEGLKRRAWAYNRSLAAVGINEDFADSVVNAGRAAFHEDIQLEAQRQLAKKGSRTLAGTPEPANKVAAPVRSMDEREKQIKVYDLLASGKSAAEARELVYGG